MTSNIEPHPSYDEKVFSKHVIAKWGGINDCLIDDANLLHVQMAHLGRTIAESCEKGDGKVGREIFEFLDSVLARNDAVSEIGNAIAISLLDYSEFQDLGIIDQVPSAISKIAEEQQECWDDAT